jgi:hypothetical protein
VIAYVIEAVAVHAPLAHVTNGTGPEFFVEHLIAKSLAGLNFARAFGKSQEQVAFFGTDVGQFLQVVSLLGETLPQETAG